MTYFIVFIVLGMVLWLVLGFLHYFLQSILTESGRRMARRDKVRRRVERQFRRMRRVQLRRWEKAIDEHLAAGDHRSLRQFYEPNRLVPPTGRGSPAPVENPELFWRLERWYNAWEEGRTPTDPAEFGLVWRYWRYVLAPESSKSEQPTSSGPQAPAEQHSAGEFKLENHEGETTLMTDYHDEFVEDFVSAHSILSDQPDARDLVRNKLLRHPESVRKIGGLRLTREWVDRLVRIIREDGIIPAFVPEDVKNEFEPFNKWGKVFWYVPVAMVSRVGITPFVVEQQGIAVPNDESRFQFVVGLDHVSDGVSLDACEWTPMDDGLGRQSDVWRELLVTMEIEDETRDTLIYEVHSDPDVGFHLEIVEAILHVWLPVVEENRGRPFFSLPMPGERGSIRSFDSFESFNSWVEGYEFGEGADSVAPKSESETEDPVPTTPIPNLAHILVIEEERDIAALMAYHLTKEGYRVRTVGSGDDAIKAVVDERPDLMVLDLILPDEPGHELLEEIQHLSEMADIPFVLLTAQREESDPNRGLELSAHDVLTKPFSPEELVLRVGEVLRRSPASRDAPAESGSIPTDHTRQDQQGTSREAHQGEAPDPDVENGGAGVQDTTGSAPEDTRGSVDMLAGLQGALEEKAAEAGAGQVTWAHDQPPLVQAVSQQDEEAFNAILESKDAPEAMAMTEPATGYTALHYAAWDGRADYVERLLQVSEEQINSAGDDGATPLHLSVVGGDERVVELLLEHGASLEVRSGSDNPYHSPQGATPLRDAVLNQQWSIFDLLVEAGADLSVLAEPCQDPARAGSESLFEAVVLAAKGHAGLSSRLDKGRLQDLEQEVSEAVSERPDSSRRQQDQSQRSAPSADEAEGATEARAKEEEPKPTASKPHRRDLPDSWLEIVHGVHWPLAHEVAAACYQEMPKEPDSQKRFSRFRTNYKQCDWVNVIFRNRYLSLYIKGEDRDWEALFKDEYGVEPEIRRWRDGVQIRARTEPEVRAGMKWVGVELS